MSSTVAFDGRVLELFGDASRIGNRIHVALITGIAADRHKVVLTVRGAIDYSVVLDGEDNATRHNDDPKPFVWTASIDSILEKVGRCKAVLETAH